MKKKFLSFILAICFILPCAFSLTACGGSKHTHNWDAGVFTTEATPEIDGVKTYTCKGCGETKTETFTYLSLITVSAGEWNKAFSDITSSNGVAKTIVLSEIGGSEPLMTVKIKGDTLYFYSSENHDDYEIIITKSNGIYYYYEKLNDSWTKTDISEIQRENIIWDCLQLDLYEAFEETILASATFNETDGTYSYTEEKIITQEWDYIVSFMDGKVTKWTCIDRNLVLTYDYSEPTIEVPQV